jgi:hypothetical protein
MASKIDWSKVKSPLDMQKDAFELEVEEAVKSTKDMLMKNPTYQNVKKFVSEIRNTRNDDNV